MSDDQSLSVTMSTNRYATNAPIVCEDIARADACACAHGMALSVPQFSNEDEVLPLVEEASREGYWICLDSKMLSGHTLRHVIQACWLKGSWDHNPNFRLWILLSSGDQQSDAHTPFLLDAASIFLKYTNDFNLEFDARELVSAVEEGAMFRVYETRQHLKHMSGHDVVKLLDRAPAEEIVCALFEERVHSNRTDEESIISTNCEILRRSRCAEGFSPVDISVRKGYIRAVSMLRDIGCKSERFDFERLLDDSFRPMLEAMLDPMKPFPIDAVQSTSLAAAGGKLDVLRKLFECRVDVDFSYENYPLVEACTTNNMNLVHVVLDRMSATGVNAFRDYRIAAHFLNKLLLEPGTAVGQVSESVSETPLNDVSLGIALRLADAVILDAERVRIPYLALKRASLHSDLMVKVLECVDIEQENENLQELLYFFIWFDPANAVAKQATVKAIESVGRSGSETIDRDVFNFIAAMCEQGPIAAPMIECAVEHALKREFVHLTYRVDGVTLLMCAVRHPPNLPALSTMLQKAPSATAREQALAQVDHVGNNVLKRMIVTVGQNPEGVQESLPLYGDAVKILVENGCDSTAAPPAFPAPLFTYCARQHLGELCYELLPTRKPATSVILGVTTNTLALMIRRQARLAEGNRPEAHLLDERPAACKLSLPHTQRCHVTGYLPLDSLCSLSLTNTAWYFAVMDDRTWLGRQIGSTIVAVEEKLYYLTSAYRVAEEAARRRN